jgi:hypothetical protein
MINTFLRLRIESLLKRRPASDSHVVYEPFLSALESSDSSIKCIRITDNRGSSARQGFLSDKLYQALYWLAAASEIRHHQSNPQVTHIVLREFSTPILWFFLATHTVAPAKLVLVNNHNLSFALSSFWQKRMYEYLYCKNISFVYFESKAGAELVRPSDSCSKDIVLPFNIIKKLSFSPPSKLALPAATPIVCIPGYPSLEKGSFELLEFLIKLQSHGLYSYTTLLPKSLAKNYNTILPQNFVPVDADSRSSYLKMIDKADIAIVNYKKKHYFFRHSGVVLDCASAQTFVICPSYPLLQSMISWPTPIGLSFDSLDDLHCMLRVAELKLHQNAIDWQSYLANRNLSFIIKKFNDAVSSSST